MKTGIILTYTIEDIAHLVREDVKAKYHDTIQAEKLTLAPLSFRIDGSTKDYIEQEIGENFSVTAQLNGINHYIEEIGEKEE